MGKYDVKREGAVAKLRWAVSGLKERTPTRNVSLRHETEREGEGPSGKEKCVS